MPHWPLAVLVSSQLTSLRCTGRYPSKSLRERRAGRLLNLQRNADVQAEYYRIPLGVDGGAWLGRAYPQPPL